MPLTVSAVVTSHDPARRGLLAQAVASALAAGADEVLVVRPYSGDLPGVEGRYRAVPTSDESPAGKHADGVEAATGDVVAFLDDDDTWKPEKVGIVRERFAARPDLVVLNHAYDVVDDDGRLLRPGAPAGGRWTLSSNLAVRRSFAVPRTALLRAAGWENDEVWVLLADVDAPGGFEVLPQSLTRWRYHSGNVSRSHRTTSEEFRAHHARLYPRWVRAETAMLQYARARGVPETSPLVARRRSRLAGFGFLAALENGTGERDAAHEYLRSSDATPSLRSLARLAAISPGLARFALFRFNRFH